MKKSGCLLSVIVAFLYFQSCSKNETVAELSPGGDPFQLRADQYSMNHYFVDTSYKPFYEPYYQSEPPIVNAASQIVEVEVWIQRQGTSFDSTDRFGVAWVNLPPRPVSGYDSTYRNTPFMPGVVEAARFYRPQPSSYRLTGDGYLGVLSFNFDPVPDVIFAVAYRRADATQYGDFLRNGCTDTTGTPMVLKMVKPRDLFSAGPTYHVAWGMLLKNIYVLHHGHISKHEFQLDILRTIPGSPHETTIQGHLFLGVLGLDRFATDGTPRLDGDGQFDLRPERTITPNVGEIIFPSLRPFDNGIREYFLQRGLPLPGTEFLYLELYDTTLVFAQQSEKNGYILKGWAIFD